jgi:hypothetical protein
MQIITSADHGRSDARATLATPDCSIRKGAWESGLSKFADCTLHVAESCDTVRYTDAYGVNVTHNDDNTVTPVPCTPPDPWKG